MPTPNDIVLRLAQLSRDLDSNVTALEGADLESVQKRHVADLAMSKAFLQAQGSVEQRKNEAFVQCERLIDEAAVAEAVVRHLKRRADAIKSAIDVGRSLGSNMRAEISLAGAGHGV